MTLKRTIKNAAKRVKSGAEKAGGTILNTKHKATGTIADFRRGRVLQFQGYGKKYESELATAKRGKKDGKKRQATKRPTMKGLLTQTITYKKKK